MDSIKTKKICINEVVINGLIFVPSTQYDVEYNPSLHTFIIYHVFGYTDISKNVLDAYFI